MAYTMANAHIHAHSDTEKERESCPFVLTFRISLLMTIATIDMEDTTNAARLTSSILLNISM
jgi:hypothetical protein